MPPAPSAATISYGPSREPVVKDILLCANYTLKLRAGARRICQATRPDPNPWPVYWDPIMASDVLWKRTMLLLNRAQRAMLVDKVPDIANLAAGALLFGQFLSEQPFSRLLALFGVAIWLVLMGWSVALAAGDE